MISKLSERIRQLESVHGEDKVISIADEVAALEKALEQIADGAADNQHAEHCHMWRRIARIALDMTVRES